MDIFMTDPSIGDEERESRRLETSAWLGNEALYQLAAIANEMEQILGVEDADEIATLPPSRTPGEHTAQTQRRSWWRRFFGFE
jgi:hypothetical protein